MLRGGLLEGIVVATAGGAAHVATACAELGAVAYLASPAGDYFSGCVFTLGAAGS